ncbi:MAG: dethiobiotin synthase [Gammaproteobacteria bacterium]
MTGLALFVTGTDTGAGKTSAACALIRALRALDLRVAPMKPVASGACSTAAGLRNDDALALLAACSADYDYDDVNPYVFEPATAPHLAAADAGVEIRFAPIQAALARLRSRADVVVVEGAGGWRVPLGADASIASLARALGLPVLLVVGVRLGCINHALLTLDAIRADGCPIAGWIANAIDPLFADAGRSIDAIAARAALPPLATLPWQPQAWLDCDVNAARLLVATLKGLR